MIQTPLPELSLISLENILIWEENNEKLKKIVKETKPSNFYNLFHKNYIGFKSYEELSKFKKYFNSNNYRDNPLFKLSKTLRPYIASLVIAFIVIICYVIFYIGYIHERFYLTSTLGSIATLYTFISFLYFIVYISLYFSDRAIFKKLEFNFDEQIQEVFYLYKKRNKQPIYLAIIIILFISCIPHYIIIFLLIYFAVYNGLKHLYRYCGFCGLW